MTFTAPLTDLTFAAPGVYVIEALAGAWGSPGVSCG
jgi:hypothetical protein